MNEAFWVNIKKYLAQKEQCSLIKFNATKVNRFNINDFQGIFIPLLLKEIPELTYEESLNLFESDNYSECYLGLMSLFKRFADRKSTWDILIDFFCKKDVDNIPPVLIYYMAYLPHHADIAYYKESVTHESKEYGKDLIKRFKKDEVIKLLKFIDEDNRIARGTIGQSAEALISSIPSIDRILEEIILDGSNTLLVRENAAAIYAYHTGKTSLAIINQIPDHDSWYLAEIKKRLTKYGYIDFYM